MSNYTEIHNMVYHVKGITVDTIIDLGLADAALGYWEADSFDQLLADISEFLGNVPIANVTL